MRSFMCCWHESCKYIYETPHASEVGQMYWGTSAREKAALGPLFCYREIPENSQSHANMLARLTQFSLTIAADC